MHFAVKIDRDAEVLPYLLSHRRHPRDRLIYVLKSIHIMNRVHRTHLDRAQAFVLALLRLRRDVRWRLTADAGVYLHTVAHFAAEQFINGQPVKFPLDIPKRLIYPRDRAHHHRAAAIEARPEQRLPDVLNLARITSDEKVRHIFHRAANGARLPFDDRLAPAFAAVVRCDLQKQPAGRDREKLQLS